MAQFNNIDLEYVVDDYYDMFDFDDESYGNNETARNNDILDPFDSDYEDDFDTSKPNTDTSASEARNGNDIQGIPWEKLNFSRAKYREVRLKQYKNYEGISRLTTELDKECLQVENGKTFYDFQFNTRIVKPTIVHFQLRNLLCATSKHDVYLTENYSVMHWSSVLKRNKEVLNAAKPITPLQKVHELSLQSFPRIQISTMAITDNLMVAGGFRGELICKYINQSGVAFCSKITEDENAITNSVDISKNPNGVVQVITANNDAKVKVFDTENFRRVNNFSYPWSVNNTSVSPDGKLLAVLGDSKKSLITELQSGKLIADLEGHLDYSFSSAWHPNGITLATGNQDMTCRLWDLRNLSRSTAVLKGNVGAIRCLKYTCDGKFLAMAEATDFVHVFDTEVGYVKCQEIDLFGEIAGISFSPDSEALFVGVADRVYGSLLEFNRLRYNTYLDSMS